MGSRFRFVNYRLSSTWVAAFPSQLAWFLTVIGRTEGLFGTTDSIAVSVDDVRGRIGRIQLIYLDPDMSSVIARRLADAFGSPEGSALDPTGVEWRNRIRRVWRRRGARFTVNLRDYRYLW